MLAAVRNFIIAFLIAALVFGAIASFITIFIAENVIGIADTPETDSMGDETITPPEDTRPVNPDNPAPPSYPDIEGESFSVLLIGTDYRPDDFVDYIEDFSSKAFTGSTLGYLKKPIRTQNADMIILVTVSEETRQIVFTSIPSNTRITVNGSYRLLGTRYDKGGVDEIVDFVNYLTAVPADFYIKANITDAGSIIDLIDGVSINVPADVMNPYYNPMWVEELAPFSGITGERDFETRIAIEAGERTIDSSNIFALMHYRTERASSSERDFVVMELARQTLKKAVSAEYLNRAPEIFAKIMKLTDSNMTVGDLTSNIEFFRHYNEFSIVTLTYPGTYSTLDGEACFVPDLTEAYELFRSYRGVGLE